MFYIMCLVFVLLPLDFVLCMYGVFLAHWSNVVGTRSTFIFIESESDDTNMQKRNATRRPFNRSPMTTMNILNRTNWTMSPNWKTTHLGGGVESGYGCVTGHVWTTRQHHPRTKIQKQMPFRSLSWPLVLDCDCDCDCHVIDEWRLMMTMQRLPKRICSALVLTWIASLDLDPDPDPDHDHALCGLHCCWTKLLIDNRHPLASTSYLV